MKLTAPEEHLIRVQGVFSAALAIASVFLSLYLFKVGGFEDISLFYIAQYACMPPAFIAAGYLMRTRTTRYVIRVGLLVLTLLFALLLTIGTNASHVPLLLGAIMGIGEGIYWPGINLSEYIATHSTTRNLYYGRLFLISNLASVIGLPLSGIVLWSSALLWGDESGYYILFALLVIVLFITRQMGAGIAAHTGLRFSIKDIKRHKRNSTWNLVLLQNLIRGTWAYALPAFSAVLLYLIIESELGLSLLSAFTTILTGAASFVAGKMLQRHPKTFLLGAIVVPIGMMGFAYQQNWFGIFCYAVLILVFDCFAQNFTYKAMYDVMETANKAWQDSFHFIVEREVAWNCGRVISFAAVLWVLNSGNQAHSLAHAIAFVSVCPLAVGAVQYLIYRSHNYGDGNLA